METCKYKENKMGENSEKPSIPSSLVSLLSGVLVLVGADASGTEAGGADAGKLFSTFLGTTLTVLVGT